MRKVLKLACREYLAAIRTKGFIIGLVIAPVLMSGGFILLVLGHGIRRLFPPY